VKVMNAMGSEVGSRQSEVGRNVACGDVIGHWSLVIGGRALALPWAGMNSRFQNKSVTEQRIPKPFTIHHSPFTKKEALPSNAIQNSLLFTINSSLKKRRCQATQTKTIHHSPFTIHPKAELL